MSTYSSFKQDLPPQGGYQKIVYERNPGRVLFKGRYFLAAYLGITATSMYFYAKFHTEVLRNQQERQGGLNAVYPFLLAERDRAYLKRIHFNREQERELMKNVEGWEVGTYYGEPIFKTIDPDETWVDPIFEEFYVNVKVKEFMERGFQSHYC